MEKFTTHTGVGVPLRRSNVDTDQIIPAVYLKRITRTGFEDALFAAWRNDPEFILNQDAYRSGSVLIAGPDFGTGSSREHAVWALKDYGFRVILSTKFADIFRGNAGKQGLVAGVISQEDCESLWKLLESEPGTQVTVSNSPENCSAAHRASTSPRGSASAEPPRNLKRSKASRTAPSYQRGAAQVRSFSVKDTCSSVTQGRVFSHAEQMPTASRTFPQKGHFGGKNRLMMLSKK